MNRPAAPILPLSLLFAMLLAVGMNTPAAAACRDEVKISQKQLEKIRQEAEAHRVTAGQPAASESKTTEAGWYGTPKGIGRGEELLENAAKLAESGKEDSCRDLVQEARRAAGLK